MNTRCFAQLSPFGPAVRWPPGGGGGWLNSGITRNHCWAQEESDPSVSSVHAGYLALADWLRGAMFLEAMPEGLPKKRSLPFTPSSAMS